MVRQCQRRVERRRHLLLGGGGQKGVGHRAVEIVLANALVPELDRDMTSKWPKPPQFTAHDGVKQLVILVGVMLDLSFWVGTELELYCTCGTFIGAASLQLPLAA